MDESTKNLLEIIISAVAAVATLAAVVYAVFSDSIKNLRNKVRLDLNDFNIKGHYVPNNNDPLYFEGWYFHLKIVNLNPKRFIEKCYVELINVKKKDEQDNFVKISDFIPMAFAFPPSEINIKYDDFTDYRIIDFLRLGKSDKHISPCAQLFYNNFNGYISSNETCRYYLKIRAKDYFDEQIFCYEIYWDGNFPKDNAKISEHVVVKRVQQ